MASWSGMRHKLENEYLAESLRGRIQYFCTTYRESHDREGAAAIRLDGRELVRGGYFQNWTKARFFPKDEKYNKRMEENFAFLDDTALRLGVFDQRCFYRAFDEFTNQSIDASLQIEDLIVRIFAVLDRRVGKRRLERMKETLREEDEIFNMFFAIRADAEGVL